MKPEPRTEVVIRLQELKFTRFLNSSMLPDREKGKCKWCGGKSQRVWCSEECRAEAYIRMGYDVRYKVMTAGGGLCAKCGIDMRYIGKELDRIKQVFRRHRVCSGDEFRKAFGFWYNYTGHYWEADHILPVCEGGGCCGIENYQILCLKCHKKDTASLAKRRTKKK